MSQTVVLKVGMSCQGCVGAVKRVLGKMEGCVSAPILCEDECFASTMLFEVYLYGVESFDIDMEQQKVTVKGNVQPEAVLQTVSKTGKATSFWEEPAEAVA